MLPLITDSQIIDPVHAFWFLFSTSFNCNHRLKFSETTMQMQSGAKKAKAVSLSPNGQVKREMAEEGAAGEEVEAGGAMIAAVEGDAFEKVEITMRIDMAVLHCPLCLLPLKPPTYQCAAGHLACSSCHGDVPGKQCHACDGGGVVGVYARCPALDTFLRAAKIPCPNDLFGCRSYVAYYDVAAHQRACPHAPCSCSEPRCDFLGSPPMLLAHLVADHSWPVSKVPYGEVLTIHVPESERRHLIVAGAGEDERVFVLSVGALGVATAVSVACVRANAAAGPRYRCKLWAHAPGGAADFVHMDSAVVSSAAAPGEVAVHEAAMFLTVPPCLLHMLDAGTSKEMLLRLSITIDIDIDMP
uniref:RING-type E3 ubiquitin transferase n=1 Tax=Oryza punctata TaxID=4537 RepID=A0A0E0JDG9_ORYPU